VNNLVLIGMPGAGKSTVGVLLAKALGYTFLDTDLSLQRQEGKLLQALVDSLGQEGFLDLEADLLSALTCDRTVVATGGSAVYRDRSMAHLKALGPVVYLHVPLPELARRLGSFSRRGVAMAPGQTLADLYACRAPLYEKWADLTLEVGEGQRLEDTVSQLLTQLAASETLPVNLPTI